MEIPKKSGRYPSASFAWRMLHQLLVKENSADERAAKWTSEGFLSANASDLTLPLALLVIYVLLLEFDQVPMDSTISLFIGVDEYEKIPEGSQYERNAAQILQDMRQAQNTGQHVDFSCRWKGIQQLMYLWKLMDAFDQCRSIGNLYIYPSFAGHKVQSVCRA